MNQFSFHGGEKKRSFLFLITVLLTFSSSSAYIFKPAIYANGQLSHIALNTVANDRSFGISLENFLIDPYNFDLQTTAPWIRTPSIIADTALEQSAQGPIINGKVTNTKGNPISGATINIKGTNLQTKTDSEGKFSIELPEGATKLTITHFGMEKREIGITDLNPTIVLKEKEESLKEVTVYYGYDKKAKRKYTGAVSRITGAELKIEGLPDLTRMIEGKLPGITVQNITGTFGTTPRITVRGGSSIFSDIKPLWVIDGVVQEDIINLSFADLASGNSETLLSSALSGINPNDVQTVEVLKDAAATSIYGSRSPNGVVVITTKQGQRDSPLKVHYSFEESMKMVPSYNQYNILNSQETMTIFKEMQNKGYLDLNSTIDQRDGGVFTILAQTMNKINPETGQFQLRNDPVSINNFLRKYELANTDWFKVLFRPSIIQNHSLSFSGGGKNNAYYASLAFYNDPGWTIADNVKQIASNLKGTFFINDNLNISITSQASLRAQSAPGSYESKQDLKLGKVSRDFDINPFSYVLNTNRTLRPYDEEHNLEYYRSNWAPMNIINELQNNYIKIKVQDIRFNTDIEYKINKNLTYNFIGVARYVNSSRQHNILENTNVVMAHKAAENRRVRLANVFLFEDPEHLEKAKYTALPNGGFLREFSNNLTSFNLRNSITYRNSFNEKHELDAFLGTELRNVNRSANYLLEAGLQYSKGQTSFTDSNIIKKTINDGEPYFNISTEKERTVGFFGNLSYTYDRRYTFSVTGRFDGSNKQATYGSVNWLPTYNLSGRWNLMEEKFMKDFDLISNLNIRASYGLTAAAGSASNAQAIYNSALTPRFHIADREKSIVIKELKNKELTFEKQYETNLGIDLGLFNNRLQLITDIYRRRSFDLIDFIHTSAIGGQNLKIGNNADLETRGIEASLVTKNINSENFKWQTTLNFTVFSQKITNLKNLPNVFDLVNPNGGNTLGRPRNSLYSYRFNGLNKYGVPTFVLPEHIKDKVAGANFQDFTNITEYLKYEGAVEPNKSIGLFNTFSYKNWTLDLFFIGSFGNKIRLGPLPFQSDDLGIFTRDLANRWVNPQDETKTNIPVLADERLNKMYAGKLPIAFSTYNYSDQKIASGDFIRLKNITVGWEFPKTFKDKLGISFFTLKGSVLNPWLILADKRLNGQDPEFRNSGGVAFPVITQYTFSLKLSI